MKKLLYLFLAISIISCGGDDDENSSTNFLSIYNGITWAEPGPFEGQYVRYWYNFSPNGFYEGEAYSADGESVDCGTNYLAWGANNSGYSFEVIENSSEILRLFFTETDGQYNYEATITYTVSSDGNSLIEEYTDDEFGTSYSTYVRDSSFTCP